ncbi:hypothetical protein LCGC14_1529930 [marine sediment metagenome]|uniref:Uncharacterized protein n=2 Tax=root TaxID=1 RepID=A0A831VPJ6_9FLAO|nr:hypothetical protein [Pricia antarctica]
MIVFAAQYCPCIHESDMGVISLHENIGGAYSAMKDHLLSEYNRWYDSRISTGKKNYRGEKFGENEFWNIKKYKVK